MKRGASVGVLMLVSSFSSSPVSAWGFVAHRIIVENAAASLPAPMAVFYGPNRAALSDASIEPDTLLRDKDAEKEKRRHYFDIDELGAPPFSDLPYDQAQARRKYGDDRIDHAGLLPWRILDMLDELSEAFRRGDPARIISLSGWLSHYVGDLYQPLHTTKNFDGQQTCNQGVHAAFETDMIDRLGKSYRLETALGPSFVPAEIPEPRTFVFSQIIDSHARVSDILRADTESMDLVKKQRKDYFEEMERRVGGLARAQLRLAESATASLWYTAWIRAGRPQLPPATARPRPRRGLR